MTGPPPKAATSWLQDFRLLPGSLRVTLAGVLVASVLAFVFSEAAVREAESNARAIDTVLERLEALEQLRGRLLEAESAQRGYLLTGEPGMLERFSAASLDMQAAAGRLLELESSGLESLRALAAERLDIAQTTLALANTDNRPAAVDMVRRGEDRRLNERLRTELDRVEDAAREELEARQARQSGSIGWARLAVLVAILLALALLAAITALLVEQARRQQRQNRAAEEETERMQRLVAARTAELSELTAHLQQVREQEKSELARNLHDELGGLLTAARMDLSWLQGATKSMGPEIAAKLDELNRTLSVAMDMKRRVVESLRPALLDHFGLAIALSSYVEDTCRKSSLRCDIDIPEDLPELPRDSAVALFRIAQEALTNVVRHADASAVKISMSQAGDRLRLLIEDDGVGLDLQRPRREGLHGISGMRHRVQSLGGNFQLSSTPGRGTTIDVSMPLEPDPARAVGAARAAI